MRTGGRAKNTGVEPSSFFRGPPQPVEGVAVNELVPRRINLVEEKIAPAPFEVFFREVEARDTRPRFCGANGKTTSISEGVQNLRSRRLSGKKRKFRRNVIHQKTPA